jgi:predicted nucleic acid-binding protein
MRFWDSSALIPLLVQEPSSGDMLALYEDDPEILVWWSTSVECVSALTRLERENSLASEGLAAALDRLDAIAAAWREVLPIDAARRIAIRLLRVHTLRAADALQLAAAVIASESHPATLPLVTLDDRLAAAAEREGFRVVTPPAG